MHNATTRRRSTVDASHARKSSEALVSPEGAVPSTTTGLLILGCTIALFIFGSYAILFSAFFPQTGIPFLDILAQDTHYKYFFILLIPTTSYFVIANWVGWQYYRNS